MKYWLHPKISWLVFKKINERFNRDTGPTPEHGDKILHRMFTEDRSINIYVDTKDHEDPIVIATEPIPPQAVIIRDPK